MRVWTRFAQEGSVTIVKMLSSGINYLSEGILRVTGGGGSGFEAIILVDQSGALTGTSISDHGTGFTSDPDEVLIYYRDKNEEMVSHEDCCGFCILDLDCIV
jgi:hypothetical protein